MEEVTLTFLLHRSFPSPCIPCLSSTLRDKKRCAVVEEVACTEVCLLHTWTEPVLCPGTASRAPFLRDDLQRGRLSVTCTSSAVAKQPLDLIWPLQQPQIPAEPVHPYTGTGNAKAEIVFLANWLSHLLSVCWSFLVLFCFRLGVGVDVTLQS